LRPMSNLMSTTVAGLNAASQRFESSAKRVVSDKNADLAGELVTQKQDSFDFEANLKVMKAADEMLKQALDILV
jgi:flagellar basal body rod protein FlgC